MPTFSSQKKLINAYVETPFCTAKKGNIRCKHNILYSYKEPICWYDKTNNIFYIITMKFSASTSKHTNSIKYALLNNHKQIEFVERLTDTFEDNKNFQESLNDYCSVDVLF